LDSTFQNKKARKFSQAVWDFIGILDPALRGTHDWHAIYAKLDKPKKKPARKKAAPVRAPKREKLPAENEIKIANQQATIELSEQAHKILESLHPVQRNVLEDSWAGLTIEETAKKRNMSPYMAGYALRQAEGRFRILMDQAARKSNVEAEADSQPAAQPIQANFTTLALAKPTRGKPDKIEAVRKSLQPENYAVQGSRADAVEITNHTSRNRKNKLLPTLAERNMQSILKALATPDKATLEQIKRNPSNKERLLAEWSKKSKAIKEDLKREGYDIDSTQERFEEERRLAEACIPEEIRPLLARADAKTQAVVRAVLEGRTWGEVAEDANLPIEKARLLYNAFRDKVNEWGGSGDLPFLDYRAVINSYFERRADSIFLDHLLTPSLEAAKIMRGQIRKPDDSDIQFMAHAAGQFRALRESMDDSKTKTFFGSIFGKWRGCNAPPTNEDQWRHYAASPTYQKAVEIAARAIVYERQQEERKRHERSHWSDMNWKTVEHEIANLFRRLGFNARATPPSNDGGVDVVALKDSVKVVIQCKQHETVIGSPDVVQLIGTAKIQRAEVAIMYSKSGFTSGARETARNAGVILWTLDDLVAHARKVYGT
jgi:hypothetical protein